MNTQKFQNVDAAKWLRIKSAVKDKSGIDIATDSGTSGAKGIKLSWVYDSPSAALTVTLLSRSWFDPKENEIDADIAQWIQGA